MGILLESVIFLHVVLIRKFRNIDEPNKILLNLTVCSKNTVVKITRDTNNLLIWNLKETSESCDREAAIADLFLKRM